MLKQIKGFMTEEETETLQTESLNLENDELNEAELQMEDLGQMQRNVVRMFEPVSKSSADKIMTSIKRQELCIVNFKHVSEEEGEQIINILSGALFALDGQIVQMTGEIVVCAPKAYMLNQENNS